MTSHIEQTADASPEHVRLGFERMLFFSDAVFAIAITLLVVDLRLPELLSADDEAMAHALWEARWDVLAYLLSFLVIGQFWLAHWRRYHHIQRVDARHAVINLAFLGAIAFIPFPTSVLAGVGDPPTAVVFYAVSVSIAALLSLLVIVDAWRRGLYASTVTRADVRAWSLGGLVVPTVMLVSLLFVPFIGSTLTELSWFAAGALSEWVTRWRP
jgi:uncharacterized membrane protein